MPEILQDFAQCGTGLCNEIGKTWDSMYRAKLLGKRYVEFSKAIGLVSHGVGIGSFVYLRRIIESLVYEAIDLVVEKGEIIKEDIIQLRFAERIKLVAKHLPEFLTNNPKIYSVISKGIHELEEEECLQYFETVRAGIELILDEKLAEKECIEKIKQTAKLLSEIN